MFKSFFETVKIKAKDIWSRIKNSKVVKIAAKIAKKICTASIIFSAFNIGCIHESVSHMTENPTTFADTIRWTIALCIDWVKNIKARNFTWDVKQIFIPLVITGIYLGSKVIRKSITAIKFFKTMVKNSVMEENAEPEVQVVDVFA